MKTITTQSFEIRTGIYLSPTPAGAFFAVQSVLEDPLRKYLMHLLAQPLTPAFDESQLQLIDADADHAMRVLYHLQNLGYLQALHEPCELVNGPLEEVLPPVLQQITDSGKAILADEQGFYISLCGYAHEAAEELSALSASFYSMQERHRKLLHNNLGIKSLAWGLIDAAGNSEIGFWPLFFPRTRFTLIQSGMPQFNCHEFVRLISYLAVRYNKS